MGDEFEAMRRIEDAMKDLEPGQARRVLGWAIENANDNLGAEFAPTAAKSGGRGAASTRESEVDPEGFETLGDLMDVAKPSSTQERVMVVTYWFQKLQKQADVTGQQVNTELKNLGYGASNITSVFDDLKEKDPALAQQTRKEGTTRQARKRYRLTYAATKHVEQMLSGEDEE